MRVDARFQHPAALAHTGHGIFTKLGVLSAKSIGMATLHSTLGAVGL